MEIKEGDLVKAWDDGDHGYTVGLVARFDNSGFSITVDSTGIKYFRRAVKIPKELAEQLEKLGV